MTEKSLLSMREIARELNLNYRTVIDAKNQFSEFIIAISGKYPPDYKDFFMVSAHRSASIHKFFM